MGHDSKASSILSADEERQFFYAILDALPAVVFAKDLDHRFVIANQFLAQSVGATHRRDVLGKTDRDFYRPEDAARFEAEEKRILESGMATPINDAPFQPLAGQSSPAPRWFRGLKSPLRGEDGRLIGLFGASLEVTEQLETWAAQQASEERYRRLFEESPISLWEEEYAGVKARLDGLRAAGVDDLRAYLLEHPEEMEACMAAVQVLNVNRTSVQLYKAADKAALIRNVPRIIPPEERGALIDAFLAIVDRQPSPGQKVVDRTLDGAPISLIKHWSFLPDGEPGSLRVLIALVDVTRLEALEEQVRRQALLLEEVRDAVIGTDNRFLIQTWNRGAEKTYGWQAEEVLGKPVRSVLETQYSHGSAEEAVAQLYTAGHWEDEVRQRHKDGHWVPILSSVSLLSDAQGNPAGAVAVNRDISGRKQREIAISEAEQRFQYLFDEAPVMYITIDDKNGLPTIRDVNRAYADTLGYSREELIGQIGLNFLDEPSRAAAVLAYARLLAGEVVVEERTLITRTGERVDALIRAVPRRDNSGQIVGLMAMYTNVTPIKEAERRQQREADRLHTVLHIASKLNRQMDLNTLLNTVCKEVSAAMDVPGVTLSLVDHDQGRFVHAADFGLPSNYHQLTKSVPVPEHLRGDLSNLELIDINPIDSLTASVNYAMYMEQGLQLGVIIFLVQDNRLLGSLNLHITDPKRSFGPDDLALLRGIADVTTQAILNAQLREATLRYASDLEEAVRKRTAELEIALDEARKADQIKSQFVIDINHELRTPLTNITLYLDLLKVGRPERQAQIIETIRTETGRLRHLIEDILDLSRFDLGRVELALELVDLNALIELMLAERVGLLNETNVAIRLTLREGLGLVLADRQLIAHALRSLLDNALSHGNPGQVEIITAPVQWAGRRWQTICVSDTGPGIPEDELPHIFERFYRGEKARDSGLSGTGLGLALCQEIAGYHQGHITVESKVGEGSRFTIWLPASTEGDA